MKFIFPFLFLFVFGKSVAQVPEITENTLTVMGAVLLHKMELMDYPSIEKDILATWKIGRDAIDGNDQTISFQVDGATFLVGFIPAPLPSEELIEAVDLCHHWKDARLALKNEAHIAIALIGEKTPLELYRYFSQITAIVMRHTNSMGAYMANQTLLISKEMYLEEAEKLSNDYPPVQLWVYYGLIHDDAGSSVYTYGLKEFGLREMEIIQSGRSLEEALDYMLDLSQVVISQNPQLKEGAQVKTAEGREAKISLSNGVNIGEKTWKVDF